MSIDYFIGVSASEIDRLRAQHEAWRLETETLWKDAAFDSIQSVLDLGCGPGFTSLDLARLLGSSGRVCAVDKASAYLNYLAAQSRELPVSNITVQNADISQGPPSSMLFDGAFCRWFLAFFRNDLDNVLGNIRECLRPGGIFAAMEYLTLKSVTCMPSSIAFDANTRAWIEFYSKNGGDSSVGELLPQRLTRAGFRIRSTRCVGGVADPQHRWWNWWGRLIEDFGPRFVETGFLQGDEWQTLEQDWKRLSATPDAFIHTPILLQIISERI